MKIYIAGPDTAPDERGREENTRRAMDAGLAVLRAGHEPFVPHLAHYLDCRAEALFGERQPWEDWMRLDLAYLPACDALLRLPGASRGADVETATAVRRGIPVYDSLELLLAALAPPEESAMVHSDDRIEFYLTSLQEALASVDRAQLDAITAMLALLHARGGRLLLCGNGGSAATASHLVADLQKIMQTETGVPLKALALTDSIPLTTAWANDTEYAAIFARQVEVWGEPGDILWAISGSGNSENVLQAVRAARERGMLTLGFCGFDGGKLAALAQVSVVVPLHNMQRIEDMHMILGHLIFSLLRDRLKGCANR